MIVGMSPYRRSVPVEAAAELELLDGALVEYRRLSEQAARALADQIGACLDVGATWGEVGARLGMSKQGARAHWQATVNGVKR